MKALRQALAEEALGIRFDVRVAGLAAELTLLDRLSTARTTPTVASEPMISIWRSSRAR